MTTIYQERSVIKGESQEVTQQLAARPTSARIRLLKDLAATAAAEARATSAGNVQQVRQFRGLRVCLQQELEAGDAS